MCASSSFVYSYHLVDGISVGLTQSDPIKRCLLYLNQTVVDINTQFCFSKNTILIRLIS